MNYLFNIPLSMHIGKPSSPTVKEGDLVERGQCVAEPDGLGARIHSSVSGVVKEISEGFIVIEASENQSRDYVKVKKGKDMVETVFNAGVVGAGGAGFPTHVKLKTDLNGGHIVANAAECEPALHHNIKGIEKDAGLFIRGIRHAMRMTGAGDAVIGIKGKNENAVAALRKELGSDDSIKIHLLADMYPMGEERALIHDIFGTWLEPTQLPSDAGCVVLNVETLKNIAMAIDEFKPVIDKDFTIIGKIGRPDGVRIFSDVPVGTSVKKLIEDVGGIDGDFGELIIGGPYTGKAAGIDDSVVTKISGGAIVTIPFPQFRGKLGLLVCACGADEARLRDIARKMGSEVVSVAECKNVVKIKGANKCMTPGDCPGQAQAVLKLKREGAERLLISNCSDCSNTVMCSAPNLGLPVYHHTDHVMRTIGHDLTRRLPFSGDE
ncbi:proline reductase-associated electron transfer protein PrdC [Dethiosulfovibrio faecalis]|uniref:proline reductase-associated electron transfer protein PrdC n=1 Tax=Dethiosulfovibrio faecalis TaxID=2720018 RepID=UPI00237CFE2C|nr:proline reductase-associated electron transfer protein PrdC [Dethiosulfovibrio faecalis]